MPVASPDSAGQCPTELEVLLAASVTEKYRGKFTAVTGVLQFEDTREPAMFVNTIAESKDIAAAEAFLDCFVKEWKEAEVPHVAQAWLEASFAGRIAGINIQTRFSTPFQVIKLPLSQNLHVCTCFTTSFASSCCTTLFLFVPCVVEYDSFVLRSCM